jgi:tetratricopeptide (TPR) repeat protein
VAGNRHRYEEALSRGAQSAWDSNWRGAIEQFEIARAEFPDQPVPYARLGQAYFELAQYDDALRYYQQAARLDPRDVVTLGRIADILERKGQLSEAARIYMAVAEVHLRDRDLNSAISNWERATRLDANLLGARQRLCLVYRRMGRIRESIREHLALARIYQMQGNIPQAAAACKAALEMDPNNTDVLAAVGLLRQGLAMAEAPADAEPPVLASTPRAQAAPSISRALRAAAQAFESDQVLGWEEAEEEAEGSGSPVDEAPCISILGFSTRSA